ncbi:MAG: hypothetical protein QUS35_02550, partial [bacterium]|nr:hypothetical protein [bacterium]
MNRAFRARASVTGKAAPRPVRFGRTAAFLAAFSGLLILAACRHAARTGPSDNGWEKVPAILSRIRPPVFPERTFNIAAFGAAGDGLT